MSAVKKERTPEQIEAARARMAKARAARKSPPAWTDKPALAAVEHKRSSAIPDELEGLTANNCCTACHPDRCVISGANICIHPFKSGIQSAFQMRPDVIERYNRAKKILAHSRIDLS